MVPLPPELWLIIFDIVIEEGIIRLDQCDYIKFPYIQPFLSAKQHRNRFFGSYWRLRLVCRRFNAILRDPPYMICQLSIFPLSTAARALFLDLETLPQPHFEPLFAEMMASERVICLDVTLGLPQDTDRPNISDFFRATARQALRHVERLTLRLSTEPTNEHMDPFWTPLHDSFPLLVTLFIIENHGRTRKSAPLMNVGGVVLKRLEILYISREFVCSACNFPRLRHVSLPASSAYSLRELASCARDIETLLIRSNWIGPRIDLTSFPFLKLLGLPDNYIVFAPVGFDHPLEHIWLYSTAVYINHGSIVQVAKKIPNLSRITLEVSSLSWQECLERAEEYRRANFESIGLTTRPIKYGDTHIIIDKIAKGL